MFTVSTTMYASDTSPCTSGARKCVKAKVPTRPMARAKIPVRIVHPAPRTVLAFIEDASEIVLPSIHAEHRLRPRRMLIVCECAAQRHSFLSLFDRVELAFDI